MAPASRRHAWADAVAVTADLYIAAIVPVHLGFGVPASDPLLIVLDHGQGYMSLYGHNEALTVNGGDWVDAGEVLARSGINSSDRTAGAPARLLVRWARPAARPSPQRDIDGRVAARVERVASNDVHYSLL